MVSGYFTVKFSQGVERKARQEDACLLWRLLHQCSNILLLPHGIQRLVCGGIQMGWKKYPGNWFNLSESIIPKWYLFTINVISADLALNKEGYFLELESEENIHPESQ